MPKLLVLYYSMYGHVETLANAVAEGARSVAGVEVTLKRVPETMPPDVARKAGAKLDQAAPVASPKELGDYDAIIFGTPTRFGNMAAQMRNFLDQTGGLWVKGVLVGKVGSVFTSTGTGGGNESTIISFVNTLMHHGFVYVGLPYACPELSDVSEVKGGSPWGAATIAGADGSRQPSAKELAQARFQRQNTSPPSPRSCTVEVICPTRSSHETASSFIGTSPRINGRTVPLAVWPAVTGAGPSGRSASRPGPDAGIGRAVLSAEPNSHELRDGGHRIGRADSGRLLHDLLRGGHRGAVLVQDLLRQLRAISEQWQAGGAGRQRLHARADAGVP